MMMQHQFACLEEHRTLCNNMPMNYKIRSRFFLSIALLFAGISHGVILLNLVEPTPIFALIAFSVIGAFALAWADARARHEMASGERLWL